MGADGGGGRAGPGGSDGPCAPAGDTGLLPGIPGGGRFAFAPRAPPSREAHEVHRRCPDTHPPDPFRFSTEAADTAGGAGILGILGGTFDPVHNGHLRFAEEARHRLGLDAVALVPAGIPVHRGPARATADQRRAMLAAAVRGRSGCYVDERELAVDGPGWTIDTLASFRAESGKRPLCLLLGADQLEALDAWRRWPELTDYAHLVVARRTGATRPRGDEVRRWVAARRCEDPARLHTRPAGSIFMMDLPARDISSTAIRARCASGGTLDELVPQAVAQYIRQENLYSDGA